MQSIVRLITILAVASFPIKSPAAEDFRLVRSLSGPSGTVVGTKFVFDEVRSRFVHPQDKALMVYFEWEGPGGPHVLSGLWKGPDGRVASISPDVKIESTSRELTCYWTYTIDAQMAPGIWTLEVRIDGQPAGSHTFEIAGTNAPQPAPPSESAPRLPTLNEIFQATLPSLVWIRKLDASGHAVDVSLGFVAGKDRIATALQAVDGAGKLEIEFSGGRKVQTDQLVAWSRAGDWAEIALNTGDLRPLSVGDPKQVAVGDRLIVFDVEGGAATIGGIDISGWRTVPGFGDRTLFSPGLPLESAGGPLLDLQGKVVGIVGGSLSPGARCGGRRALRMTPDRVSAITPISAIPQDVIDKPSTLGELLASGVLTAPVRELDELIYATTTKQMTTSASAPLPRPVSDFSLSDKQIWILSEWERKGKESKGLASAKAYDDQNRLRVVIEPKKTPLFSNPTRLGFLIAPAQLGPGVYRIDLIWNDQSVWRTFIKVVN